MILFTDGSAEHHSDIGYFLHGTVLPRYANEYANFNSVMKLQIIVECKIFGRNTPILGQSIKHTPVFTLRLFGSCIHSTTVTSKREFSACRVTFFYAPNLRNGHQSWVAQFYPILSTKCLNMLICLTPKSHLTITKLQTSTFGQNNTVSQKYQQQITFS